MSGHPMRPELWSRLLGRLLPTLAGTGWKDRSVASLGAVMCVGLTALICLSGRTLIGVPLLFMAPVGASAVLMCALPASPLAQPWSIIGGNTVSALAGLTVGSLVHDPALGAGLAVALAILGMTLARCLHPPGGAVALLGMTAASSVGFSFAVMPVALDSVLLVALGWAFHHVSGHSYPHRPAPRPVEAVATPSLAGFQAEDLEGALRDMGEVFDVAPEDLDRLVRRVEARARARASSVP